MQNPGIESGQFVLLMYSLELLYSICVVYLSPGHNILPTEPIWHYKDLTSSQPCIQQNSYLKLNVA